MSTLPLNILLIEDSPGDARLIREMFREEKSGTYELTHVLSMKAAAAFVAEGGAVNVILLDMNLPDANGTEALARARAIAPGVPVLVLTGLDDEALATHTMRLGAQDYLVKGQVESRALPRALRHSVERHRMQVENDSLRDRQMRLKDEFLSHVSHELRSPLSSIYSFASILVDGLGGDTSPQQDEYLRIILNNVQQLQMMIEDLLEVSRMADGSLNIDPGCFPITEAITYAVESFQEVARRKEIELKRIDTGTLPSVASPDVFADPLRIRQVLTILIDNAIKFTPAGGTIGVSWSISSKEARSVQVTVSDTGPGIPAEECELVFRHLYQVSDITPAGRKGLGLGLHIARELINRMGGRIWVESIVHKGSRFSFTVPVFSLEGLLTPLGDHDLQPDERIAVITIGVHFNAITPQIAAESLAVVRKLLHGSLRPHGDVLVPNPSPDKEHRLFFLIAYTSEPGVEVILKRIANQLRRNQHLQSVNFGFGLSSGFLPPIVQGKDESAQTFVDRLAAAVRRYIADTADAPLALGEFPQESRPPTHSLRDSCCLAWSSPKVMHVHEA